MYEEPLSTLNESDGLGARRLGVLPKEEKEGLLERKGNIVLLGGGVGCTAAVSDYKDETGRYRGSEVTLVHCCRR